MKKKVLFLALVGTCLSACDQKSAEKPVADDAMQQPAPDLNTTENMAMNPLLKPSTLEFFYPHFDRVEPAHFAPAFEQGMQEELSDIDAITTQEESATFENTIVPLEKSGELLSRVSRLFFSLTSAHTNDDMEAIRSEISPKLAAHSDAIVLNEKLFARIHALFEQRESLNLDKESLYLLEETHKSFVRNGALLNAEQKEQLKAFNTQLAELTTQFAQNVLKEVNNRAIVVDSKEELAGLPEATIEAAAKRAKEKELEGKYLFPLLNTTQQPIMSSLENRALRERVLKASMARGNQGGEFDNREIVTKIAKLRAEKAKLLGYNTHADYKLDDQTAKTVAAVNNLMSQLVAPAVAKAREEGKLLQAMINKENGENSFSLQPWDWAYYSEKVRKEQYAFDESQLKPYFELNSVFDNGVFYAAEKLFGITFKERHDLPVYQEDVRVWDVFDTDGEKLAIFIGDFYARPSKRGGAWMNAYVSQSTLLNRKPVVANHLNIPKPTEGEPTLLTWDEVETAFHEFGHALHGMFSNVKYPSTAGTSVPRDFVEYPSQVNEMWATWPEILANYAKHYETGEPMPRELLDKMLETKGFNEGFGSTETYAATLLDQAWHQLQAEDVPSAEELIAFEAKALQDAGFDYPAVPPRYRTTYFSHIMGGYDAGYYSYTWSEVLDADSVQWFKENGGLKRENGDHFRETLLSKGGSQEAMDLFNDFRGRDPKVDALLMRQGIL